MLILLASLLLQAPDSAALARAVGHFEETDGQALIVMHDGRVVHEQYRAGGSRSTRQLLASGSKSLVGLAAVAAEADGLLQLSATAARYLPEWQPDARKSRITLRQLLSLESGLESGNPGTGCGGPGSGWKDALTAGTFAEPGTAFRYGPFPFLVVGQVVESVQHRSFAEYLETRLLAPLGVTVEWRLRCADGKPQLAGGAAMTARDWATLGEFLRLGGVHNGRRLLPDSAVRALFRPSSVNPAYGLSWWLAGATVQAQPALGLEGAGATGADRPRRRQGAGILRGRRRNPAPTASTELPAWMPPDVVMAAGAGKQRLYIIPSRGLVVVRMGPVRGGRQFTDLAFLRALLGPAT